jgi:hypothetical protein
MKAAFALCAALVLVPAFADELVIRTGNDSVRLADAPCESQGVLQHMEPAMHVQYKAAYAVVQGEKFVACWRALGSAAHLIYEDGDQGIIPMSDLKRELSA